MSKPIAARCARALAATALAACSVSALAAVPAVQRQVLEDLYNSTNGPGWTISTNWLVGDPCEQAWYGVVCSSFGDAVTRITLPGNNLVGTSGVASLPANFNALTSLIEVNLDANALTGAIPALTGLNDLFYFRVSNNNLTGPIPQLSGLQALEKFLAYSNGLTGPIPELTNLPALEVVSVSYNRLTGSIPPLAGVPTLKLFWARDNQLEGAIPALDSLVALEGFEVSRNALSGVIPPLGSLAVLKELYVSDNQLSGPISALPNTLIRLNASGNNFSGPVPPAPPALLPGLSQLCLPAVAGRANNRDMLPSPDAATNAAWNIATGETDWNAGCRAAAAVAVPTLGQWALMAMGVLMTVMAGLGCARTRQLHQRLQLL